jgi:hypothetical protein
MILSPPAISKNTIYVSLLDFVPNAKSLFIQHPNPIYSLFSYLILYFVRISHIFTFSFVIDAIISGYVG